jgi:hypothetical protein
LNEKKLKKHNRELQAFIKNRAMSRPPQISEIISKHAFDESNGIQVDYLVYEKLTEYGPQEKTKSTQAHLIFDSQDSYSHMVIENRELNTTTHFNKDNQSMLAKLPIRDIAYITTDMDLVTQFDYTNKLSKQTDYEITVHGRLVNPTYLSLNNVTNTESVAPHQLGLDVWRV